jgi:hypothetical protein
MNQLITFAWPAPTKVCPAQLRSTSRVWSAVKSTAPMLLVTVTAPLPSGPVKEVDPV